MDKYVDIVGGIGCKCQIGPNKETRDNIIWSKINENFVYFFQNENDNTNHAS